MCLVGSVALIRRSSLLGLSFSSSHFIDIREHPEFYGLLEMDKSYWPRCLLWHGRLPLLSGGEWWSSWAEDPAEGAGSLLECALGSFSSGLLAEWQLPDMFGAEGAAERVAAEPDVWTDGSLVEDKVSGASSSGSGFFTGRTCHLWADRRWGHLDDDVATGSCRGYCSVPGPLQTVQRAEFWEVILALQAADGIHFGVDDVSVVRHVGRLLDGNVGFRPAGRVKDGDLILLISRVLRLR